MLLKMPAAPDTLLAAQQSYGHVRYFYHTFIAFMALNLKKGLPSLLYGILVTRLAKKETQRKYAYVHVSSAECVAR
jgi:hypothetical protein